MLKLGRLTPKPCKKNRKTNTEGGETAILLGVRGTRMADPNIPEILNNELVVHFSGESEAVFIRSGVGRAWL